MSSLVGKELAPSQTKNTALESSVNLCVGAAWNERHRRDQIGLNLIQFKFKQNDSF